MSKLNFIESAQVLRLIQLIRTISIHRQLNVWKLAADGGNVLQILTRFDL
jgi:hypothetical protein